MNTEKIEDYYTEIALATLPRDRWGALGLAPKATEGAVWTAPLTLEKSGDAIAFNADGVSGLRVEIADARFHLLPDYSGANAGTVAGDGLASAVTWPKAGLDGLVGRPVRLRIAFRRGAAIDPQLFAAYVSGR